MGRFRAVLLLVAPLLACSSAPSGPDEPGLTGQYSGNLQDDVDGGGSVTATFVDGYGILTGTWEATGGGFEPAVYYIQGSLFDGGEVLFNVSRSRALDRGGAIVIAGCSYRMSGSFQRPRMVLSYETFGCSSLRTGRVTLAR
jgi:hypothetical protein